MEAYFSGGNTIPGAQLATTIRNMAALGRIGQQVLEAHGIHEIDPNQRYSFRIRRSIHATVLKRFGPEALYSFGFAYGDYWSHIHEAAGELRKGYLAHGHQRLQQSDALAAILGCCFELMNDILEKNSIGDIRYGATVDAADTDTATAPDAAAGLCFRATMTNTSSREQEAFPRGDLALVSVQDAEVQHQKADDGGGEDQPEIGGRAEKIGEQHSLQQFHCRTPLVSV